MVSKLIDYFEFLLHTFVANESFRARRLRFVVYLLVRPIESLSLSPKWLDVVTYLVISL